MGRRALRWTRDKLLFKNNMIEMSNYIDDLVKRLPNLKKSKKINDIKQMIKDTPEGMTKKEIIEKLRWGGGILWTPYRRALLDDKNIYDINDKQPSYFYKKLDN
jgi:hypothetical protein